MEWFVIDSPLKKFKHVDEEDFLPIDNSDDPALIKFPENLFDFSCKLSVIDPDSDIPHKGLILIFDDILSSKYSTNDKNEIVFIIEVNSLKLNFVCFQKIDSDSDLTEYCLNTARLKIEIQGPGGVIIKISETLRNNNLDVSNEIVIKTIGPNLMKREINESGEKECTIYLNRPIPYFSFELIFKLIGEQKQFIPHDKNNFPILSFDISLPSNFNPFTDMKNLRIESPKFGKVYEVQKNKISNNNEISPSQTISSIERRKRKISEENDTDDSISNSLNECVEIAILEENMEKEYCLIISYSNFKNRPERTYSEVDIQNIKDIFTNVYSYEIIILENLSTKQLRDELEDIIEDKIKPYHNHIVVFILSHGEKNVFATFDGQMTFDEIIKMFLPENCEDLTDKEKIFIISCCRGDKINGSINSSELNTLLEYNKERKSKFADFHPAYADVFVGFATPPGYKSLRGPMGTIYISRLCNIMKKKPTIGLRKIHHLVQRKSKECINEEGHHQVNCHYDALSKSFYFNKL